MISDKQIKSFMQTHLPLVISTQTPGVEEKDVGGRTPFETKRSVTEPLPISPSTFRGLIPGGEWASVEDTLSRMR